MNNIYYVYAYLRKKDDTPYYIGKGKNRRLYQKHKVTIPSDKTKILIMYENLSEEKAIELEIRFIKEFGRKDLGTGILLNRTNGGEGISGAIIEGKFGEHNHFYGKKHSNKTKKYLAEINSGRLNPNYGKSHSDEVKHKIRLGNIGKTVSKETRDKIALSKIGKTNGLKGKSYIEIYGEEKAKLLISNRPKCSDEKKRKISETLKKRNELIRLFKC